MQCTQYIYEVAGDNEYGNKYDNVNRAPNIQTSRQTKAKLIVPEVSNKLSYNRTLSEVSEEIYVCKL